MYVKTMMLKNIKAFEKLQLNFLRPQQDDYSGLNVLVGGNASGKSTLLKCIAMAASGPIAAGQLVRNSAGWVKRGFKSGDIDIELVRNPSLDRYERGGTEPNDISARISIHSSGEYGMIRSRSGFDEDGLHVPEGRGPWSPSANGWFLAAYGPFRRLTGSSTDASSYAGEPGKVASCLTLFREDAALSESEAWLKHEHARNLEQKNGSKASSNLVDEIEAHLHPSWQRLICEWLKTRFPQVQFFVTTHSPLIVQAADPGGIFVLPLPEETASGSTVRKLDTLEEQRVLLGDADTVLLGRAFGLEQTWSVRADKLVREYEMLAAIRQARGDLSAAEQEDYASLTKQLHIVFNHPVSVG